MALTDVLGHDHVKAVLARLLERGRLPGALLLAGPAGVGKKKLAIEIARALVCESSSVRPCDRCHACLRSAKGIHPDVFRVDPATATAIKIDQVRDLTREILSRPYEGRARAFVIDDAHLMTEEAANALLKSLEEPPPTSHVLLVTASPQALLPTIRSRCQMLRVSALPSGLIERYLVDQASVDPDDAHLRAALSGGSLGQALAFESAAYRGVRDGVLRMLEVLPGADVLRRLESAQWLEEQEEADLALRALRSLLRDVAALASGAADAPLLNADMATRLVKVASGPLGLRAVAACEATAEAEAALRGNANKALTMDVLVDAVAG